jgi:hypothetical protein
MARAKVVAQPPHQKEPQRKPMCDDDDVILAGRISAGAHKRSRTRHIGQIFRYAGPGNTASVRTNPHSAGLCSLLVGRRWQTYHETVSVTRRGSVRASSRTSANMQQQRSRTAMNEVVLLKTSRPLSPLGKRYQNRPNLPRSSLAAHTSATS